MRRSLTYQCTLFYQWVSHEVSTILFPLGCKTLPMTLLGSWGTILIVCSRDTLFRLDQESANETGRH
jgi:hypothetical protein